MQIQYMDKIKEKVIKKGSEFSEEIRALEKELEALCNKYNITSYAGVFVSKDDTFTLTRMRNTDIKFVAPVMGEMLKVMYNELVNN